jgi:hypothetical protein
VNEFIPPGAWVSADPNDMPRLVELAASMTKMDARDIVSLVIVVGNIHGNVAVISGHTHPMAMLSLLAQGIERITIAEIEALGQLG